MIRQQQAPTGRRNPKLKELARTTARESNLNWITRALADTVEFKAGQWTFVVLLGGTDTISFRLRVAQSHLRRDMLPSYWSHVAIVDPEGDDWSRASLIDVPLDQPGEVSFPPTTNGVQRRPISRIGSSKLFANVALIGWPVAREKTMKALDRFQNDRSSVDCLEHIVRWLGFAWGVGRAPNPLYDNFGLPSACMVDAVFGAAELTLTPGLDARAACPEAIWISALRWAEFFDERYQGRPPAGRFTVAHDYPIIEDKTPK